MERWEVRERWKGDGEMGGGEGEMGGGEGEMGG